MRRSARPSLRAACPHPRLDPTRSFSTREERSVMVEHGREPRAQLGEPGASRPGLEKNRPLVNAGPPPDPGRASSSPGRGRPPEARRGAVKRLVQVWCGLLTSRVVRNGGRRGSTRFVPLRVARRRPNGPRPAPPPRPRPQPSRVIGARPSSIVTTHGPFDTRKRVNPTVFQRHELEPLPRRPRAHDRLILQRRDFTESARTPSKSHGTAWRRSSRAKPPRSVHTPHGFVRSPPSSVLSD